MPTTIIKTIKPAGGGDHLTLNAFDSVEQKDLVGPDEILVAECHPGGNLVTPGSRLFIGDVGSSWNTGPNNYLEIRAAPGFHYDGGPYDTTKFPFAEWNITTGDFRSFRTSLEFFRIKGIQMRARGVGGRVFLVQTDLPDADIRIEESLLISDGTLSASFPYVAHFTPPTTTSGVCGGVNGNGRFINNVVYFDTIPSTAQGVGVGFFSTGDTTGWDVFNNTIICPNANAGAAIMLVKTLNGTLNSQNNYIAVEFTSVAYFGATKGANDATSNAEALTAALRNVAYDASTVVVPGTTPQSFNTALVDGTVLVEGGADLSGSGVINDVTGVPRIVPYSIGAHQLSVGGIQNEAYWRYWRNSLRRRNS